MAEASYRRGLATFATYRNEKLVIATKAQLTAKGIQRAAARKQQLQRTLTAQFESAIRTGNPEFLAASTYYIGLAQWEYGNFLKNVQLPPGLSDVETTAAQHDRVMSVVQVLTHFQTQVMGLTLARLGIPLEETQRFTSPVYLLELYTTARHFAQASALYGPIEMRNPRTGEVTGAFRAAAAELAEIIARGDQVAFDTMFEEVRGFFGTFTTEALEQSSYLIDRIVERT